MKKKSYSAELLENRLVVWDAKDGSKLFGMGFYGKPVGIPKPKDAKFDAPLNIDLFEGLYLLEKGIIEVYESRGKLKVSAEKLKRYAKKVFDNFVINYMVYKDLRDQGYVVLPGIKFGCEFAVYERGPGIDHAPYLVSVKESKDCLTSTDVVRAGRLATTVRKRFIIALPNQRKKEVRYLKFKWFKA
jgi:tRNA-intron endonuclease